MVVKNFYDIAVRIQNASNPIAVVGELREAMIAAHGTNQIRKDPAVLAIFYKVYDMLGAPTEKEMHFAYKQCEAFSQTPDLPGKAIGSYGKKGCGCAVKKRR
jgi:hypothetical protein